MPGSARLVVAAGSPVVLSNSRGPETLAELVEELSPPARAATFGLTGWVRHTLNGGRERT
ncbi:hypothetical protein Aab01nite_43850 [Paractinoplanes abujensis]|uniref:Uncharacterized protein n=1 Tax=Paractinoplanes abujensis TaxID=882441 RepID=A0A7W7FXJ9_9ACTN|nr:hypothetical protein [Actinoplanes abujensis]MBB4690023.1 hypothetical protein [Actinoplanes abujensis]GID20795.1 hypothetical protein Aab01nite_43850 [Actinoplanes abujensis]